MEQTAFDSCRSCHVLYTGNHSCPGHDRYIGRGIAEWGNYLASVSDRFSITVRFEFELRCRRCGVLVKRLDDRPEPPTDSVRVLGNRSNALGDHIAACVATANGKNGKRH